jgi:hypothetical protein
METDDEKVIVAGEDQSSLSLSVLTYSGCLLIDFSGQILKYSHLISYNPV